MLEPRSRSTLTAPFTTSSSPLTRSRLEVPRQEALPFRSVVIRCYFVLAILWQIMCTLCLYSDTIASADLYVFGSVWPPYLVIYWFILLCLVLCCDIFIVTPWSRSCTRRVWLLYMIVNRGRYKLVSELIACRKPPSNSLVEVEFSLCKTTFLTVSCGLSAHVANWVVLGSFVPYLYSGNLLSYPFGKFC